MSLLSINAIDLNTTGLATGVSLESALVERLHVSWCTCSCVMIVAFMLKGAQGKSFEG